LTANTSNPFTPPVAEAVINSRPHARRFRVCRFGWAIGTLLLSVLFGIDLLLPFKIPGGYLYVTILASLLLTFVCSFAAPIHIGNRVLAFFAAVVLMIVQIFIIGILAFMFTGLEGIQ
jgi:hypothetical protein